MVFLYILGAVLLGCFVMIIGLAVSVIKDE